MRFKRYATAILVAVGLLAGCSSASKSPDKTAAATANTEQSAAKAQTPAAKASALPSELSLLDMDIAVLLKDSGEPTKKYNYEGGTVYEFANRPDTGFITAQGKIRKVVMRAQNQMVAGAKLSTTPAEVKAAIGAPEQEGKDEMDGKYYMTYRLSDKHQLEFVSDGETAPVYAATLSLMTPLTSAQPEVPVAQPGASSGGGEVVAVTPSGPARQYVQADVVGVDASGIIQVRFTNTGPVPLYNVKVTVTYDGVWTRWKYDTDVPGFAEMAALKPGQNQTSSIMTMRKNVEVKDIRVTDASYGGNAAPAIPAPTQADPGAPAPAQVQPAAGDQVVEGMAVAFPSGKIILMVNDKEQEYPVASSVQMTKNGRPSEWSVLHANLYLKLRIRGGAVVAVDIQ